MKAEVARRDEHGDRIAVIHAYAPGDGLLSFVAQDPHTHKTTEPPPTWDERSGSAGRLGIVQGWVTLPRTKGTLSSR